MEKVFLSRLDPALAAQLLAGCARLDPRGITAERDIPAMAARSQCFAATAGDSQAVYLVRVENGVAWIDAAKGYGPADWTALLLPTIEAQSKGAASVAFQTGRPGLVRRALRQGYAVRGWIVGKDLQ
jgi:hypothetical protein